MFLSPPCGRKKKKSPIVHPRSQVESKKFSHFTFHKKVVQNNNRNSNNNQRGKTTWYSLFAQCNRRAGEKPLQSVHMEWLRLSTKQKSYRVQKEPLKIKAQSNQIETDWVIKLAGRHRVMLQLYAFTSYTAPSGGKYQLLNPSTTFERLQVNLESLYNFLKL